MKFKNWKTFQKVSLEEEACQEVNLQIGERRLKVKKIKKKNTSRTIAPDHTLETDPGYHITDEGDHQSSEEEARRSWQLGKELQMQCTQEAAVISALRRSHRKLKATS